MWIVCQQTIQMKYQYINFFLWKKKNKFRPSSLKFQTLYAILFLPKLFTLIPQNTWWKGKQCRPWSDWFWRSNFIWVCKCHLSDKLVYKILEYNFGCVSSEDSDQHAFWIALSRQQRLGSHEGMFSYVVAHSYLNYWDCQTYTVILYTIFTWAKLFVSSTSSLMPNSFTVVAKVLSNILIFLLQKYQCICHILR